MTGDQRPAALTGQRSLMLEVADFRLERAFRDIPRLAPEYDFFAVRGQGTAPAALAVRLIVDVDPHSML